MCETFPQCGLNVTNGVSVTLFSPSHKTLRGFEIEISFQKAQVLWIKLVYLSFEYDTSNIQSW